MLPWAEQIYPPAAEGIFVLFLSSFKLLIVEVVMVMYFFSTRCRLLLIRHALPLACTVGCTLGHIGLPFRAGVIVRLSSPSPT